MAESARVQLTVAPGVLSDLQGYHQASEEASRQNRNLLQYGAAAATALGIGAGSGSIFALADSVAKTQDSAASLPGWGVALLAGEVTVLGVAVVVLLVLLCRAYVLRRRAEQDADAYLARLIAAEPARYWPKD
jgi:hypothetical protein